MTTGSAPAAADHRLLKTIVIGLGILLVLGFGALVVGLAVKGGKLAGSGPGSAPLLLPPDALITDMALSEHQLILHVKNGNGEQLLLVDLSNGRIVRRFPVTHEAAAP